jgi:hypothetical protein
MITQRDILAEAERRRNEIARAETERLIRRVMRNNAPSPNGRQRWLTRLGGQLETWGHSLQARYDEPLIISGAAQHET